MVIAKPPSPQMATTGRSGESVWRRALPESHSPSALRRGLKDAPAAALIEVVRENRFSPASQVTIAFGGRARRNSRSRAAAESADHPLDSRAVE